MMTYTIRNFLIALSAAGTALFTGCVDLSPIDYSEINPSNFPRTEEDLKTLVLSCYHPLRSAWYDGMFSTSERGVMFVNDACTEILTKDYGPGKYCSELNYRPETSSDLTYFYYTPSAPYGFANKISRCTLVLDQIAESNLPDDLKIRYSADVRCARGFLAYTLFDMFGPLVVAPLETLKHPLKEEPLPRLSHEAMVRFIEEDLTYAAKYLPLPQKTEYGKFSRGLAKMLLIRLYLHETVRDKTYYDRVETLARELMTYGYRLENNYLKMFEIGGQGAANGEIIWAIPCPAVDGASGNQWHMSVLPTDFNDHGMTSGYGIVTSTWWFYDHFEKNDIRKTYLLASYTSKTNGTVDRNTPNSPIALGPIPMKYGYDPDFKNHGGLTGIDQIVYRYADVLLSLAEALVMKPNATAGGQTEALELMNQIRRRAGLPDKTQAELNTPEKFIDQLLVERSHEFWCENGQYRADLIRHNKLVERSIEVTQSPYANKYKELYPLPLSVINDGKGAVKQNPGYER